MIPRLLVDDDLGSTLSVGLNPDQAHYLRDVLRREVGDEVILFNGRDGEWRGSIVDLGKKSGMVRCESQIREQTAEKGPWLLFAPIKRTQTDLIVQKATELGVSRLLPVITARTQSERVNLDRLRKIAIEAAEQCERLTVPAIAEPVKLSAALDEWKSSRRLWVCAEAGPAVPLAEALQKESPEAGALLIGPEGGFDPDELAFLAGLPFSRAVSLGPRILKAETAAMAALAIFQALAGDGKSERAGFPRS